MNLQQNLNLCKFKLNGKFKLTLQENKNKKSTLFKIMLKKNFPNL